MCEARLKSQWDHTSTVLALIANVNRDPKKTRASMPRDFHPFVERQPRGIPITRDNFRVLKRVFVDQKPLGA